MNFGTGPARRPLGSGPDKTRCQFHFVFFFHFHFDGELYDYNKMELIYECLFWTVKKYYIRKKNYILDEISTYITGEAL